ncbi:AhpC/TSA family protein [Luteolibacter sp. AS25]|uniref:AhpC/TSA family protein n=1 Tax=Luteolibacter sp. AS25 TaxID=3135776 RepID=UPI00398A6EE1
MTNSCEGGNCRVTRWMQLTLLFAGIVHLLFSVWVVCCPFQVFDLLGITRPIHPMLWRLLGVIVGGFGLAFLLAAKDPLRHWLVITFGVLKFILGSVVVISGILGGELPHTAFYFLIINDLIWIVPFTLILWTIIRAHAGIPVSRSEPYSMAEAAQTYRLSTGETLSGASEDRPLVLVFLRHFGCTFTRQILRGLQDLEVQAKENNAQLVLVHMLQSGQEINYLGSHSNIPRIADPRCELYRAFGLGKGGLLELFGPHVMWRAAISVFKGCGVGHLAGDGLQMPGAFVFHKNTVIAAQPAHTVADIPDLHSLFKNSTPEP